MLKPIYELLFEKPDSNSKYRLGLAKNKIVTSYKTHKSNDPADMQAIIDQKLAPGKISAIEYTVTAVTLFWHLKLVQLPQYVMVTWNEIQYHTQWFLISTIQLDTCSSSRTLSIPKRRVSLKSSKSNGLIRMHRTNYISYTLI